MNKINKALCAGFAALTLSTTVTFAAPPDRGNDGNRGDGDRGRVERSEAPRQMRGNRDGNVRRDRNVNVDVDIKNDRRRGDGNWRGPGYRDRIVRGHRYNWGPGVAFYFTDGYYYGECGWLKRRARETGNPVWWSRYHRCRDYS